VTAFVLYFLTFFPKSTCTLRKKGTVQKPSLWLYLFKWENFCPL